MPLESLAAVNPYESPKTGFELPVRLEDRYSVLVASRSPFHRKLYISGPCPCVIEYSAGGPGYEVVRINRTRVIRAMNPTIFGPTLKPRIDFEIESVKGPLSASVEVKSFLLITIGKFRLSIAGEVVYVEGQWKA